MYLGVILKTYCCSLYLSVRFTISLPIEYPCLIDYVELGSMNMFTSKRMSFDVED